MRGWLDTRGHEFPKVVGGRLLGGCDVPDLVLLPRRHPGVKTVTFHAGSASPLAHRVIERLAIWVRDGRLKSALPFAKPLNTIARWTQWFFSDRGGMFVTLEGLDEDGQSKKITWYIVARENHGPNIPCAPSIALANKIASGWRPPPGAMACMGLLTVEEIVEPLSNLSIREIKPVV